MQLPEPPKEKLKERFRNVCRARHLSLHTERAYWNWIRTFIQYHSLNSMDALMQEPKEKFARFITSEARRGVSASTQNQAFNALIFLYEQVLGETLGKLPEIKRANRPARLTEVPATHEQAMAICHEAGGRIGLLLRLIYGAALRLHDALRIRLKDLDFQRGEILIRASKGDKDRIVPLPASLRNELKELVALRESEHAVDCRERKGWVWLPGCYGTKNPKAHYDSQWQYLFAAGGFSTDPQSGNIGRHHIHSALVQSAVRKVRHKLKIKRAITPHSFRHASAREIERRGTPVSEIQKLLGHSDIATTMRYLGQGTGGKPKIIGPLG